MKFLVAGAPPRRICRSGAAGENCRDRAVVLYFIRRLVLKPRNKIPPNFA